MWGQKYTLVPTCQSYFCSLNITVIFLKGRVFVKNQMKKLACLMLALVMMAGVLPITARAADISYDVVGGKIYFDAATGTITDCDTSVTEAVIPEDIYGVKVIAIKRNAFKDCKNLVKVSLPDTVETIGESAFYNCKSLEKVNIPTKIKTIEDYTFFDCDSLKDIIIPDGVLIIETNSFRSTGLERITIPDSVTTIEREAFAWSDLKTVIVGNAVTSISSSLFENCSLLENIKLGNEMTKIGYSSFRNCSNLRTISIPDSVVEIGQYAFLGSGLTSIIIPDSVSLLDTRVFEDCKDLRKVSLSNNMTVIPSSLFNNCAKLTEIYIPAGIKSIYDYAFLNCDKLADVYYGGDLVQWSEIGVNDFDNANSPLSAATIHFNCTGLPNAHPLGDIDGDGEITNTDIVNIARYIVGITEGDTKTAVEAYADMNGDGKVDNSDLVTVARIIVGLA